MGTASAHIDTDCVEYVKKSLKKHFIIGLKYISKFDDELINIVIRNRDFSLDSKLKYEYPLAWDYAIDMLNKEGLQGAQAFYHNLNTLESRAGSQVPFTSINFGVNVSNEARLVSEWIMKASLDGIGKNHRTSIFPK